VKITGERERRARAAAAERATGERLAAFGAADGFAATVGLSAVTALAWMPLSLPVELKVTPRSAHFAPGWA
jgi:hypothetical protein